MRIKYARKSFVFLLCDYYIRTTTVGQNRHWLVWDVTISPPE